MNAFITLNPELKELSIIGCQSCQITLVFNDISNRLANLTQLQIECFEIMTILEYIGFVTHLSQFHQLKYLALIFFNETTQTYPAGILIDSLVANIPTMERLFIYGFHNFDDSISRLLELSSI